MTNLLTKILILIGAYVIAVLAAYSNVSASVNEKEVFLKVLTDRVSDLLKNSNEAAVYLEEDLLPAAKIMDLAKIEWTDSLSTYPLLFTQDGRTKIVLSKHYSFMGSEEETMTSIVTILFQLKRQMEGSLLPVPALRIKLFSKKFSPDLLREKRPCNVSLYPATIPLTLTQREKFISKLLPLMEAKGYGYDSNWAGNIIWPESKSFSDLDPSGNNRNNIEITVQFLNVVTREHLVLAKTKASSLNFDPINVDHALSKLIRQITNTLPTCNTAFGVN